MKYIITFSIAILLQTSTVFGQTNTEIEAKIYDYFSTNQKQQAIANEIARNTNYIPSRYLRVEHDNFPKKEYSGDFEADLVFFKNFLNIWIDENQEAAITLYNSLDKK